MAGKLLRTVGALLIILGFVHLAATPHIPLLLRGSPRAVYQVAVGPTLLNHVLVGILLLPLGYTTWLTAVAAERGEVWAKRVLAVNTVVVFSLPLAVAVFMRRPVLILKQLAQKCGPLVLIADAGGAPQIISSSTSGPS